MSDDKELTVSELLKVVREFREREEQEFLDEWLIMFNKNVRKIKAEHKETEDACDRELFFELPPRYYIKKRED